MLQDHFHMLQAVGAQPWARSHALAPCTSDRQIGLSVSCRVRRAWLGVFMATVDHVLLWGTSQKDGDVLGGRLSQVRILSLDVRS